MTETKVPKQNKGARTISGSFSIRTDQDEMLAAVKAATGIDKSTQIQQMIDQNWGTLAGLVTRGLYGSRKSKGR